MPPPMTSQTTFSWLQNVKLSKLSTWQSQIIWPWFDVRAPLMLQRMSAETLKFSGAAHLLTPPINGLFIDKSVKFYKITTQHNQLK